MDFDRLLVTFGGVIVLAFLGLGHQGCTQSHQLRMRCIERGGMPADIGQASSCIFPATGVPKQ